MKYKLELLSAGQSKVYLKRGEAQQRHLEPIFHNEKQACVHAVAEYMANLNGFTLFAYHEGREYETP